MAAFLSEMKSVRLRKVVGTGAGSENGESRDGSMRAGGIANGLARSWSAGSRSAAALDGNQTTTAAGGSSSSSSLTRHGLPSFRSLGNRTDDSSTAGEKRKRDREQQDGIRPYISHDWPGANFVLVDYRKCCETSTRLEFLRFYLYGA
jgi:hypothetical protein